MFVRSSSPVVIIPVFAFHGITSSFRVFRVPGPGPAISTNLAGLKHLAEFVIHRCADKDSFGGDIRLLRRRLAIDHGTMGRRAILLQRRHWLPLVVVLSRHK